MKTSFSPNEKVNQHFIPQFWQKRFAGSDNKVWGVLGNRIRHVSPKKHMSQDWLYTTFDEFGMPSNHLEDWLGIVEGKSAEAIVKLDVSNSIPSLEDQIRLSYFVALSACRHPDILGETHRRTKELADTFAKVHDMSLGEFQEALQAFGISANEAQQAFDTLILFPIAELLRLAEMVQTLPPCSPQLPAQMAIDIETIKSVFFILATYSVTILDAALGDEFILGDTPFPPQLKNGFTIPFSSRIALLYQSGGENLLSDWTRRFATSEEVEDSNQQQFNNSLKVTIGSSKSILQKYFVIPIVKN
jgi:Protein of unknown function (DUF4238)